MWLRFFAAGGGVFLVFVGVLDFASVFHHYGFEWRPDIQALVDSYQHNFYPYYKELLGPLFRRLNLEPTPLVLDSITILAMAFLAANAEFLIRDGTLLIADVVTSFVNAIGVVLYGVQAPDTNLTRFVAQFTRNNYLAHLVIVVVTALVTAAAFVPVFNYISSDQSYTGPIPAAQAERDAEYLLALLAAGGAASVVLGILLVLGARTRWYADSTSRVSAMLRTDLGKKVSSAVSSRLRHRDGALGWWQWFADPLVGGALMTAAAFASLATMIALALLSPFVAWRTVSITLALFGGLLIANWVAAGAPGV
jgi:hypothetical protein